MSIDTTFQTKLGPKAPSAFGRKFNRLPIEFPSRLNRENLRAIREPEAGNSEPHPNNGTRCLAPHDLRPPGSNPALAIVPSLSIDNLSPVGRASGMFAFRRNDRANPELYRQSLSRAQDRQKALACIVLKVASSMPYPQRERFRSIRKRWPHKPLFLLQAGTRFATFLAVLALL